MKLILTVGLVICASEWFIYKLGTKALVRYLKKNNYPMPARAEFEPCVKEALKDMLRITR